MGSTFSARTASGKLISMDYLPKAQARHLYRYAQEREHEAIDQQRERMLEEKRAGAGGVVVQNAIGAMPPQPTADDPMATLSRLKQMLDASLISQAEYDAKKREVLGRM